MKKLTKILSLMLVALGLGAVVGCKNTTEAPAKPTTTEAPTSPTTTEAPTTTVNPSTTVSQPTTTETPTTEGHTHVLNVEDALDPTCTEEGNIQYWTCNCGKYFSDAEGLNEITEADTIVAPTNHTLTHIDEVKATMETEGTKEHYNCSVCKKNFLDSEATQEVKLSELKTPVITEYDVLFDNANTNVVYSQFQTEITVADWDKAWTTPGFYQIINKADGNEVKANNSVIYQDGKLVLVDNSNTYGTQLVVVTGSLDGMVEGYLEFKLSEVGNSWTFVQFYGADSVKNAGNEIFALRTDNGAIKYRVDGGSVQEPLSSINASADLLYKMNYKFDLRTGKVTITINNKEFVTDLEIGCSLFQGVKLASGDGNKRSFSSVDNFIITNNALTVEEYKALQISALEKYEAKFDKTLYTQKGAEFTVALNLGKDNIGRATTRSEADQAYLESKNQMDQILTDEQFDNTLPQNAAVSATFSGATLSWAVVENASGYKLIFPDGTEATMEYNSIDFTVTQVGKYTVTIVALGTEWVSHDSEATSYTYYVDGKLSTPVITLGETKVTWEAVNGAKGYVVYVNGVAQAEQETNEFNYPEASGSYTFKVVAKGDNEHFTDSSESNEETYNNLPRLNAPVISANEANVTWEAVENATSYLVYVNDNEGVNVTTTSYQFTTPGKYTISVVAVGNEATHRNSTNSNELSNHIYHGTFSKLEVTVNASGFTWNSPVGATSYTLTVNGVEQTVTNNTYCPTQEGFYTISVVANGDKEIYPNSSEASEAKAVVTMKAYEKATTTNTTSIEFIQGSNKSLTDSSAKTFNFYDKSFTSTLRFKTQGTTISGGALSGNNYIKLTLTKTTIVYTYAISGSSSATDRCVNVIKVADGKATQIKIGSPLSGTDITETVFTLEAGEYYLGSSNSGINYYGVALVAPTCQTEDDYYNELATNLDIKDSYDQAFTLPTEAGLATITWTYNGNKIDTLAQTETDTTYALVATFQVKGAKSYSKNYSVTIVNADQKAVSDAKEKLALDAEYTAQVTLPTMEGVVITYTLNGDTVTTLKQNETDTTYTFTATITSNSVSDTKEFTVVVLGSNTVALNEALNKLAYESSYEVETLTLTSSVTLSNGNQVQVSYTLKGSTDPVTSLTQVKETADYTLVATFSYNEQTATKEYKVRMIGSNPSVVATTTYEYTVGKTTEGWSTTSGSTNSSADTTAVKGQKVTDTEEIKLTASGSSVTLTITGFTTGSSTGSGYAVIKLMKNGSVVKTLTIDAPNGKLCNNMTSGGNATIELSGDFDEIVFSCAKSGKHVSFVTITAVVQ